MAVKQCSNEYNIFHIVAKNVAFGHTSKPPHQCGSKEIVHILCHREIGKMCLTLLGIV